MSYQDATEYICKCGHKWNRHYGLNIRNRCHEEGCKCKDFDCKEERK